MHSKTLKAHHSQASYLCRLLIPSIVMLALLGCSSYQPPKQYTIESERLYNLDYENTWQRVISVFTEYNIPIRNMDKSSGLITTEHNLGASVGGYADCGQPAQSIYTYKFENTVLNMNIVVTKINERQTKVRVRVFPKTEYAAYEYKNYRYYKVSSTILDCASTGKLEKSILDYIIR